jgi:hypothetical protein
MMFGLELDTELGCPSLETVEKCGLNRDGDEGEEWEETHYIFTGGIFIFVFVRSSEPGFSS